MTVKKEVLNVETQFSSETDTIIIPSKMTKLEAANELTLQHQEEEKVIEKVKIFDNWAFNDALVASMRVARETFGWINAQTVKGFFGDELPTEVKIQTDIEKYEDCFLGQMKIASWDGATLEISNTGGRNNRAYIKITAKKKFGERINELFNAVEKELKENSIYKNKSLMWTEGSGFQFIENRGSNEIILNKNEQLVLDNFILKPIRSGKREKRGVLFAGPYGTGKTETALMIGREAIKEGHTFIYCKDTNLSMVLDSAKQYQPCVVFVEDIDEMASGERSHEVNDLLNTIDGIQTKGQGLTLIMTTNHKEKINQAFRRPGRIDVILNFELPKKETIAKMYARFLNDAEGVNFDKMAEITPEVQGAVIKEISNRALLSVEEGETLNDSHVETSIELTKMQIDFMKEPAVIKDDSLDLKLKGIIKEGIEAYYNE